MTKPAFAIYKQQRHRSACTFFVVRCLYSIIPILAKSKISRLYLVSVAEQASFESFLVENPEDRFSRDETHLQSKPQNK